MELAEDYPQVVGLDDAELAAFLAEPHLARLGTHNPDGTIHLTPNWYEHDAPDLVLSSQVATRKVRNIERDPAVTVLVDSSTLPYTGVMIYGTAVLDTDDAARRRISIFRRYIGDDAEGYAAGLAEKWEPVLIRVRPERIVSFDYRKGRLL